jgi:pimeloyl-ACP methyl ester carboxylesterase
MVAQVTPDGITSYEEAGQGRVLVLLHAFPFSQPMWARQRDALSSIGRVITPDLRGFGGTQGFEGTPSVDRMADDVAALLDGLKITEPIVLCGLSMGGYVALAFARRHAARLRGLVLADTKAEDDDDAGRANRERLIEFATHNPASAVIEQLLPKLVGPQTSSQRPEVLVELRQMASTQSTAGMIGALRAMRDRPDSTPSLAAIKVPTLVLVGKDDALTPPDAAQRMASRIPDARLVTLDNAGHISNVEQPATFNEAVRSFLKS